MNAYRTLGLSGCAPSAMRPTPAGNPVPSADHDVPPVECCTAPPNWAANQCVTPAARVTMTLEWLAVRRRTHSNPPPLAGARS